MIYRATRAEFEVLRRAPFDIRRGLAWSSLRPDIVAGFGDFAGPLAQVPGANLRAAINTTTTETNLWDPGIFVPVPQNSMRAGMRWNIAFGGTCGTTATPTIVATCRFGTNNSAPPTGTVLGAASATVTLGTITAPQTFYGSVDVYVRKLGQAASGAEVGASGVIWWPAAAAATVTPHSLFGGATATTIDQTIAQGIAVSVTWGASSASNTLTPLWVHPVMMG